MSELMMMLVFGALIALAAVLLWVQGPGVRWYRYRQLKRHSWNPKECEVEGYGMVHIHPMPVPMRLALQTALMEKSADTFSIYLWLIAQCVDELRGRPSEKLGIELAPSAITKLGEAVLDVSGLTEKSQEDLAKKSEGGPI